MIYNVQRWRIVIGMLTGDFREMRPDDDGPYVLAADAEAHERAAVEQAIRDCIAAVEGIRHVETTTAYSGRYLPQRTVVLALRALLDKP